MDERAILWLAMIVAWTLFAAHEAYKRGREVERRRLTRLVRAAGNKLWVAGTSNEDRLVRAEVADAILAAVIDAA